jgi:hypothetical protein
MKNANKITCISLLLFTGINALTAGALFIIDPSGSKMGLTINYLKASPFRSFLVPGIILFVVLGILNVLAGLYGIFGSKYFAHWALIQGTFLIGWIIIQMYLVRDMNPLHILMLIIGLIIIYISLLLLRHDKRAFNCNLGITTPLLNKESGYMVI